MARMVRLTPLEQKLKPRGFNSVTPGRLRNRIDSWRKWYKTEEWRAIR